MLRAEWGDMKLWWGGASGRGRRAYGALTTAPRKNENKSPGRSHAPAGIQPPIKITRPVPFRLVQPVTGSYQTGNLSQSLILALIRPRSATPQKTGSHKRKAIIAPLQPAENEAQKRPQSLGQVHQDQSHPNDAEGRLLQMCGNAA